MANSWEVGVMIPIPSLNRNQGEIRRSRINVRQTRMEVERAEQEIIEEVRRAASEYLLSRQLVEQYERDILIPSYRLREEKYRCFAQGAENISTFLSVQRDYDEVMQAYVEALARYRRAMLQLNIAVGRRILS